MAAWQFALALVPRAAWHASSRPSLPIWDGTAELWRSEPVEIWASRLKFTLGESAPHWDETGLMWGAYDSH
jgi:hypothetical protein